MIGPQQWLYGGMRVWIEGFDETLPWQGFKSSVTSCRCISLTYKYLREYIIY